MSDQLCRVMDSAELCRNVHPDEVWRDQATNAYVGLADYIQFLNSNQDLYRVLSETLEVAERTLGAHAPAGCPTCSPQPMRRKESAGDVRPAFVPARRCADPKDEERIVAQQLKEVTPQSSTRHAHLVFRVFPSVSMLRETWQDMERNGVHLPQFEREKFGELQVTRQHRGAPPSPPALRSALGRQPRAQ